MSKTPETQRVLSAHATPFIPKPVNTTPNSVVTMAVAGPDSTDTTDAISPTAERKQPIPAGTIWEEPKSCIIYNKLNHSFFNLFDRPYATGFFAHLVRIFEEKGAIVYLKGLTCDCLSMPYLKSSDFDLVVFPKSGVWTEEQIIGIKSELARSRFMEIKETGHNHDLVASISHQDTYDATNDVDGEESDTDESEEMNESPLHNSFIFDVDIEFATSDCRSASDYVKKPSFQLSNHHSQLRQITSYRSDGPPLCDMVYFSQSKSQPDTAKQTHVKRLVPTIAADLPAHERLVRYVLIFKAAAKACLQISNLLELFKQFNQSLAEAIKPYTKSSDGNDKRLFYRNIRKLFRAIDKTHQLYPFEMIALQTYYAQHKEIRKVAFLFHTIYQYFVDSQSAIRASMLGMSSGQANPQHFFHKLLKDYNPTPAASDAGSASAFKTYPSSSGGGGGGGGKD